MRATHRSSCKGGNLLSKNAIKTKIGRKNGQKIEKRAKNSDLFVRASGVTFCLPTYVVVCVLMFS